MDYRRDNETGDKEGHSPVTGVQKRELAEKIVCRLNQLQKAMFIWRLGAEYLKSDSSDDLAAVLEILAEQLKVVQEQIERLEL